MSQLYLPDSVQAEREKAVAAEAALEAQEAHDRDLDRYQMALALAYRAGYDLAKITPRRHQAGLNVQSNFWRWYKEEIEG